MRVDNKSRVCNADYSNPDNPCFSSFSDFGLFNSEVKSDSSNIFYKTTHRNINTKSANSPRLVSHIILRYKKYCQLYGCLNPPVGHPSDDRSTLLNFRNRTPSALSAGPSNSHLKYICNVTDYVKAKCRPPALTRPFWLDVCGHMHTIEKTGQSLECRR
jgi:hypothetical protein